MSLSKDIMKLCGEDEEESDLPPVNIVWSEVAAQKTENCSRAIRTNVSQRVRFYC